MNMSLAHPGQRATRLAGSMVNPTTACTGEGARPLGIVDRNVRGGYETRGQMGVQNKKALKSCSRSRYQSLSQSQLLFSLWASVSGSAGIMQHSSCQTLATWRTCVSKTWLSPQTSGDPSCTSGQYKAPKDQHHQGVHSSVWRKWTAEPVR